MKQRRFIAIITALTFVFALQSTAPLADNKKVDTTTAPLPRYTIDGKQYLKDQLAMEFIQSAYPRSMWSDDLLNRGVGFLTPSWYSRKSHPTLNFYPDWLVEYALREKGRPVFDGLNRWQGDITIGVGFPPPSKVHEKTEGFAARATDQILRIQKDLQSATGRRVTYIPPDDETPANFARIRIIDGDLESFFRENKFKLYRAKMGPIATPLQTNQCTEYDFGKYNFMQYLEGLFQDAVRFTSLARAQVEGYFVTDNKNNIEFAACYIWPHHETKMLNALINECLVRAMGLPEQPLRQDTALIGNWNLAHDGHSKRYVLDGDKKNMRASKEKYRPFPNALTTNAPQELTAYDKTILGLLYCNKLSAGQPRYDVMDQFFKSDDCFEALEPIRAP